MVTDAAIQPARRTVAIPLEGRILLGIVLLAAYLYGSRIPLPLIELDEIYFGTPRLSVLSLGIVPLFNGFLLVELFSLMTSPGRRWRQGGVAGRAIINRAALITSLLLAAAQGLGIARWAEVMVNPSGLPVVSHPGALFRLLTVLTLTAATAGIFALAQFLSTYGIGNGFVLLFLVILGRSLWGNVQEKWKDYDGSLLQNLGLLLALVLAVLLFRFIRSAEDNWLPAFPQGGLPVYLVLSTLPGLLWSVRRILSFPDSQLSENVWLGITLLGVPLLSWASFHLFSSRSRLEANLTDAQDFLNDLAASLRRRAVPATVLLTLGSAATLYWSWHWQSTLAASITFLELLWIVAIGLDLWDELRFRRRHGSAALLVQLDNVHFSYRLEEDLQQAEIDALARGHQFRSLYFFFGALYKIDMLVPAEQLDRARAVLAELETAREVRVF
jgi:SecY translocase